MSKPKTAVALSGGGTLGVAHLGVLDGVLQKYEIDFYAGVSAGAIVSASLACGRTTKEIFDKASSLKSFKAVLDFLSAPSGIVSGKQALELLDEFFEGKSFEDLDVPLFIGATNFTTGQRVIINSGNIAQAVRASISVPVVFQPYKHPDFDHWLVDGGLSQNFPLDILINRYKGNKIIGVNVTAISENDDNLDFDKRAFWFGKNRNLQDVFERTLRVFYQNQLLLVPKDDRVTVVSPSLCRFDSADIFKMKEIYEEGAKAWKESL